MLTVITFRFWLTCRLVNRLPEKGEAQPHFFNSFLTLTLLVCAHILEIIWFAGGFYISSKWLDLGELNSSVGNQFRDYFFHSAVTYSSLGMSEIPTGHLRFMTAMESLTGIIILTWSATFFYSVMDRNRRPKFP